MGSFALLRKIAQDLRSSYWFLPSLLVLAAIILAQVSIWIDHNRSSLPFDLDDMLPDTQVEGARATLSVISQSVIGVTGVMFSITMVAVSFASGNFGPRLIGNFMRDRGNQWCLGILISTFVYTLLILRAVQSPDSDGAGVFVPQISMVISISLAILAVSAMIYFIHHVPETINVANITADLGRRLDQEVRKLIDAYDDDRPDPIPRNNTEPMARLSLSGSGYVQTINFKKLHQLADGRGWFLRVEHGAGTFVDDFSPTLSIWATDPLSDDDRQDLRDCFALGDSRTEYQNLYFIADQLVEMIARALSPGVNDPYTAINCLNWLRAALASALAYNGGLKEWQTGRVDHGKPTFEGLFAIGFGRSEPYAATDPLAMEHFLKCLTSLEPLIRSTDESALIIAMKRRVSSDGTETAQVGDTSA